MPEETLLLLQEAQQAAQRGDTTTLAAVLARLDDAPAGSFREFVRRRILVWLQRDAHALAAVEAASVLDGDNAHARFHRGVLLARAGRAEEAYEEWRRASALDPTFADAAYNAGQAAANLGRREEALAHFAKACEARPEDFEASKKLVQALRALDRHAEADHATVRLVEQWRQSKDPAVRKLTDVVVDQFTVGDRRIQAWQNLVPRSAELHYELTFAVEGEPVTVQLESSAYGRERGVPYLLGMTHAGRHQVVGPGFKALPPYALVKAAAVKVLQGLG